MTVPDNLICWIGLNLGFQERFATLQKIARTFHPIQGAFRARPPDLKALGVDEDGVRSLVSGSLLERARREQERLEQLGLGVIGREMPESWSIEANGCSPQATSSKEPRISRFW